MKIKMRTLAASIDGVLQPDHVYDLPKSQAEDLIAGGYAIAVFDQAAASRKKAAAAKKAAEAAAKKAEAEKKAKAKAKKEAEAAAKSEKADANPPEKAVKE